MSFSIANLFSSDLEVKCDTTCRDDHEKLASKATSPSSREKLPGIPNDQPRSCMTQGNHKLSSDSSDPPRIRHKLLQRIASSAIYLPGRFSATPLSRCDGSPDARKEPSGRRPCRASFSCGPTSSSSSPPRKPRFQRAEIKTYTTANRSGYTCT
jgi:hypothetical protein